MAAYKNILTALSKPRTPRGTSCCHLALICTLRHTQNYTTITAISKILF